MRLAWPPSLRYVDPRRCDLPRKFLAYSGRGAGNERPRTESFLVNLSFHERVFLLRFQGLIPVHFRLPCRLRTFQFTGRESNLEGASSPLQPARAHETREPGPRLPAMLREDG